MTYDEFTQSIDPNLIASIPASVMHEWVRRGLVTAQQFDKYIKAIVYINRV